MWVAGAGASLAVILIAATTAAAPRQGARSAVIRRGEYLVTIGGCNDCHTPWKMGPNGPVNDTSRLLSGHPQDVDVGASPKPAPGPWGINVASTFTAWSGPWGVSFTANLTPDPETGLGKWTVENFIETMRTGRHMGRGRPIMPPMPWFNYGKMTDDDLKATFAYLKSIPPITNRVPDPIPPEGGPARAEGSTSGTPGGDPPRAPETGTGAGSEPPSQSGK
jgi:mono/diheme cytochrome c family protein